jgi:hypothetical protein
VLGSVSSFWILAVEDINAEFICRTGIFCKGDTLVEKIWKASKWAMYYAILIVPLWVPAIGGMVQVGFMMQEYGSCIKVDFNPFS